MKRSTLFIFQAGIFVLGWPIAMVCFWAFGSMPAELLPWALPPLLLGVAFWFGLRSQEREMEMEREGSRW